MGCGASRAVPDSPSTGSAAKPSEATKVQVAESPRKAQPAVGITSGQLSHPGETQTAAIAENAVASAADQIEPLPEAGPVQTAPETVSSIETPAPRSREPAASSAAGGGRVEPRSPAAEATHVPEISSRDSPAATPFPPPLQHKPPWHRLDSGGGGSGSPQAAPSGGGGEGGVTPVEQVRRILEQDDYGDDIIAQAESLLNTNLAQPEGGGGGGVYLMGGSAKQDRPAAGGGEGGAGLLPRKRQAGSPQQPRLRNSWASSTPPGGNGDDVLALSPSAPDTTEVLELRESEFGEDIVPERRPAASPAAGARPVRPDLAKEPSEEVLDLDDPWQSLQVQYKIRKDMQSPPEGKPKPSAAETELVLDEDARQDGTAQGHGRYRSARKGREARGMDAVATIPSATESSRRASGRRVGQWGQGTMARAGDVMLGRGALDEDKGTSFTGAGGRSEASVDYVEYDLNNQSFDLSTLEVPDPTHLRSSDIAMEDFDEELELLNNPEKEAKRTSREGRARKLREDMDVLNNEYDHMINEELRLLAAEDTS